MSTKRKIKKESDTYVVSNWVRGDGLFTINVTVLFGFRSIRLNIMIGCV